MEQRAAGVPPEEIRPMPKPDVGGEAKEPARSNITDELLATDWSLKLGYDGTVVLVGYRDGLVITESPMETADAQPLVGKLLKAVREGRKNRKLSVS